MDLSYPEILTRLVEAGVIGKKDEPLPSGVPPLLARPSEERTDTVPPPAPSPAPPVAPMPTEAPPTPIPPVTAPTVEIPRGLRDEDLERAMRNDESARLASIGTNAMLSAVGISPVAKPSDVLGSLLARRRAFADELGLQEKGIDLAAKRAAFENEQATRRALQSSDVADIQRREIAFDMASSRKGGGVPEPVELDAARAILARVPALALPALSAQAMERNKLRAATNKDFQEAYHAQQAGEKTKAETAEVAPTAATKRAQEEAETKEIAANAAAKRAEQYAVAAWHRAQADRQATGPAGKYDTNSIMDGIEGGTLPPEMTGLPRAVAATVMAGLQQRGVNLARLQTVWKATQQHLKTMNGARIELWRISINNVKEQLDVVEDAYRQWEEAGGTTRFKVVNKKTLEAAMQLGDGKLAQAGRYLDTTLTALVDKSGKAIMGGGTPTDEALRLAQRLLSADYPPNQFKVALKGLRADVGAGFNALNNAVPAGVVGNNQYLPTAAPGAPLEPVPVITPKPTHRFNPKTGKIEAITNG